MKATLRLKLHLDPSSELALLETLAQSTECFNAVCRYGWEGEDCHNFSLHHATYNTLCRIHPDMPSQLIVSARMKAAEALKSVQKRNPRRIGDLGSIKNPFQQGRKASCPQSDLQAIRYDARSYWV